jgi:hypothetical protein
MTRKPFVWNSRERKKDEEMATRSHAGLFCGQLRKRLTQESKPPGSGSRSRKSR